MCIRDRLIPYVSSFIFDFTTAIVGLALPIYAYTLGASSLYIGLISTSGGVAYTLTAVFFGRLSDRVNRKALLLTASVLMTLVTFSYALIREYPTLLLLSAVQGFALGIFWPNIEGFIVRHANPSRPNSAIQGFTISWSLGWIVGPPFSGFLVTNFSAIYAFYAASILFFSSIIILIALPRDHPPPPTDGSQGRELGRLWSHLKALALAYGVAFYYAFSLRTQNSLFPAYGLVLGFDPLVIGVITCFVGLMRTVTFVLTGALERHITGSGLFLGPALIAVSMALLVIGRDPWHFALACAVLGLGSGISYFLSIFTVLGESSNDLGLRVGLFEGTIGVGSIFGPFLGGLASGFDIRFPFALAGCICVPIILYAGAERFK